MRTTSQNYGVIENDGEIIGVSLGADYCAEHEWGFQWKSGLGIPEKATRELNGVECRINTRCDLDVRLERVTIKADAARRAEDRQRAKEAAGVKRAPKDEGPLVLLVLEKYLGKHWTTADVAERWGGDPRRKQSADMTAEERALRYDQQPLADVRTAWSDSAGFMVIAQTPKGEEAIKVVHEALLNNRLAVGYGSASNPFDRAGLNLIDVDKLPQTTKAAIRAADIDHLDLRDAAEATGIAARLEAAGKGKYKGYFALSPRWKRADEGKSKHKVIFWLNPYDQQNNNYGWFTVEELDQWIAGKGPIPMTEEQRKAKGR